MLVSTYMRNSNSDLAEGVGSVWNDTDIRNDMEWEPLALGGVSDAKLPALNFDAIWRGILACRAPLALKHVVRSLKIACRGLANHQHSKQ